MKADDLRENFLRFFESKGHTIHPSDSLVPENDPSLLFTGAGMNQFKDMFLGRGKLPFKRATTSQKCLRTGDIEKVGRTPRHHTFFEMLGNFSFGDYFKREAIAWAWEYLTQILKIPPDRLTISVYTDDDEAAGIWHDEIRIPEAKIFRFGESDNFWPANAPSQGPNGVCGPCSEIYFDLGEKYGCGRPTCQVGCDCDRYMEIWNLVFTQFDRRDGGVLKPLPQKNIDTGMGLERIAAVMQGVGTNFDTDLFIPLIRQVAERLKAPYESSGENGARMRRIADHLRALVFCIADGVIPSNEERGYVVRKLLRRALTDGLAIGARDAFLNALVPSVVAVMRRGYPELEPRVGAVQGVIKGEEERYLHGLDQGTPRAEARIRELKAAEQDTFPGEEAFQLYDTFGFPVEVLDGMLAEHAMHLDKAGFEQAIEAQRRRSREGTKISANIFGSGPLVQVKALLPHTEFVGYDHVRATAKVLSIFSGDRVVERAEKGAPVTVVLDKTPFYGESGGQVGDAGTLTGNGVRIEVIDARKAEGFILHHGHVREGTLAAGQEVHAQVDSARRADTARNHTATHLLQHALRSILGTHVGQAGSLVAPDRFRFDFTHHAAVEPSQLRAVEEAVYGRILENVAVHVEELAFSEAQHRGALAFFGEKYGDRVRMVSVGDFSRELCGGTHVHRTGDIGFFKIVSEGSIGSGMRRIEAVTGRAAAGRMRQMEETIQSVAAALSAPTTAVPEKLQGVLDEVKALRQDLGKLKRGAAGDLVKQLAARAKEVGGIRLVATRVDVGSVDELRALVDGLVKREGLGAAALAAEVGGKPVFIIGVQPDVARRGLRADAAAKEVGRAAGAGGGGRELLAQAGGAEPGRITEGLARFEAWAAERSEKRQA
jgi:alanyl-tRNA synthetase